MRGWLVLFIATVIAAVPRASVAHEDPPGCFQIGTAITVSVFRANGTTGVAGSIQDCEQIFYRATLQKPQNTGTICAFAGGSFSLTTPDGVAHVISNPVPCIGGTDSAEGCLAATTSVQSGLISYTASPADVVSGFVTATANYTNGVAHNSVSNTSGLSASTQKSTPVVACAPTTTSTPTTTAAPSTTTSTTLPKSTCSATKLTTAQKLALALVKCEAKAVKGGVAAVQVCRDKGIAKFTSKWASLETKPDCLTSGDAASIQGLIDSCATALSNALVPSNNP